MRINEKQQTQAAFDSLRLSPNSDVARSQAIVGYVDGWLAGYTHMAEEADRELSAQAIALQPCRKWSVEETEDGVRVCKGDHHRSSDCEWQDYVPADKLHHERTLALAQVGRIEALEQALRDLIPIAEAGYNDGYWDEGEVKRAETLLNPK